ncbi:HofP DNA utilization family protein [uncultured Citrobacter sp.]|uniref:HofP DNA utilization family protein n=1 Tax=Citrobacter sp. RHB21-C01 TaxID=2742622 RepID=UPI002596325D|nr:HofP DNA utilization family protein [uncultured Citrobacter sp.]
MTNRRWLLAVISLLLLTGMRDPFRQPEDRCHSSTLAQWRYQGVVGKGERHIGLLRDSEHRWRRVELNTALDTGWTVIQLNEQTLTVQTGTECDPPQWRWQRQGDVDEALDTGGTVSHITSGTGRKGTERHSGGG